MPTPRLHAVDLGKIEQAMAEWPASEVCGECCETVRYWNPSADGDGVATCGCTTEGAEACAAIRMPPGITVEDIRALVALAALARDGAPTLRVRA